MIKKKCVRQSSLVFFLALLISSFPVTASATVYIVDTVSDTVAVDGQISLREAIQSANSNIAINADVPAGDVSGDVIRFDGTVFAIVNDQTITLADGAGFGDLEITDDLEIDGSTGGVLVTISGNNLNRIFHINPGSGQAVSIISLILEEGDGTDQGASANDDLGGAVLVESGTVEFDSTEFSNNDAASDGGAIANIGGTLTLTSVTIDTNLADGDAASNGGGGIFNSAGSLTVNDSIISHNIADGTLGSGGGLLLTGGTIFIQNTDIDSNDAGRAGGGIEVRSVEAAVTLTTVNVTFTSNTTSGAAPGNGAGLHVTAPSNSSEANISILAGSFESNQASAEGGGLWNDVEGIVTVTGTTFDSNSASGGAEDEGGGGVFNNGGTTTLTGCVLVGNQASGLAGSGGGILNDGGTLTLLGGTLTSNTAVRAGGGIEVTTANSRDSIVSLSSVSLLGNTGGNNPGNGGGIHITDPVGNNSSAMNVMDSTFIANSAGAEGGGVWNDAGGTLTISSSNFSLNTAGASNAAGDAQGGGGVFNNGGVIEIEDSTITFNSVTGAGGSDDGGAGVFNDGRNNAGSVTITGSEISNNIATATGLNGGGALSVAGSNPTTSLSLTDTEVTANSADSAGGGIGNVAGMLVVASSTLSSNTASDGGGIAHTGAAGETTFENVTLSGNSALNSGGGLDMSTGSTVTITNSTVTGNISDADSSTAGTGGGINAAASAALMLVNSVVGQNLDNTGAANDIAAASAISSLNSLIQDGSGGHAVSDAVNGNIVGVDPLIGALADNGGPVFTHLLLTNSPAIDTADEATCADQDARGNMRPQDGDLDGTAACDIGAVEIGFDCNNNNVFDSTDIANATSEDCDDNQVPDECQDDDDMDETINACDACPSDENKIEAGACGCGVADVDSDQNNEADCVTTAEFNTRLADLSTKVDALTFPVTGAPKRAARIAAKQLAKFTNQNQTLLNQVSGVNLSKRTNGLKNLALRTIRTETQGRFNRRLQNLQNRLDNLEFLVP